MIDIKNGGIADFVTRSQSFINPVDFKDVFRTLDSYNGTMMNPARKPVSFIVRIWCEPSKLTPPGEWRGDIRLLDNSQRRMFKSAEELWEYLLQHQAQPPKNNSEQASL